MQPLPPGFIAKRIDCGAVTLNVVTNARSADSMPLADERPAIIFLHGFPEYWAAWKPTFTRLADDFLIIAPDQRGYNLSDAPEGVEHYQPKLLVGDILTLATRMLGTRKFTLAGHDWGASIAYAVAINAPDRLNGLIIVNGVHPATFQKALIEDRDQMLASQYFHKLRSPAAAERMAENGYGRTLSMFEKFSASPWLTDEEKADYVEAWSRPGRLDAMLNWYRASPIVVPEPGKPVPPAPLASVPPEKLLVSIPHLLLFGVRDQALRPSAIAGLKRYAPQLETIHIDDGDHWVIHTHGERIANEIREFVGKLS